MSLTETEEQCVHTHAKNAEEATGNDVGTQDGDLEDTGQVRVPFVGWTVRQSWGVTHHDGQPVIVEGGVLEVSTQTLDATGEEKEGQDPCGRGVEVSVITPLRSLLWLPCAPALCLRNSQPWPLPTPPTTSSFPKSSSKSVTLSRTKTLCGKLGWVGHEGPGRARNWIGYISCCDRCKMKIVHALR